MTQKQKTSKTHKTIASAVQVSGAQVIVDQTNQDIKNAVLMVSLTINAFVLVGWVTLQVTNIYDYQVASFLFTR